MELKDTIDKMNSTDYKERFIAEYEQVRIRRTKLASMIEKYRMGTLDFEPTTPIGILMTQVAIMDSYCLLLKQRAILENIEL